MGPDVVDFRDFERRSAAVEDRVSPHDLAAEKSLLGAIMLHNEFYGVAAATIAPETFYRVAHQRNLRAMGALSASAGVIDLVTIADVLGPAGLDAVDGKGYLARLVDGLPKPTAASVEHYARILKRKATLRELIAASTKLREAAYDDAEDATVIAATAQRDLSQVVGAAADPAADALPPVLTARMLCALPDPPTSDQLLGALVVRGQRHLIGGHTGRGKTSLILGVIKAMLTSTTFLGFQPISTTPRILWLDAEQGIRTIKRRLREHGLHERDDLAYWAVPGGLTLDTSAHDRAALEAHLRDGHFDVVVASPLYKLHNGDANEERAAVDLMKLFDRLRDTYNFASIFEMHCRKPPPIGKPLTMHDFFGSTAYLRGAEIILGIDRLRPGVSRLYFFKDRDGDLPTGETWSLSFDRTAGFERDLTTKGQPTAPEKVANCLRLSAPHPMTIADIMKATKYADRTVRDALKKLGAIETDHGADNLKYFAMPPDLDLGVFDFSDLDEGDK